MISLWRVISNLLPELLMAILLLWLGLLFYESVRRAKSGLPPFPQPSPFQRWVRIIWGVIFGAYMIWVLAGWFAPR
jgi:hypothetical protein